MNNNASTKEKTRITIRLSDFVLAWFKDQIRKKGKGSYQNLINEALKEYIRQQNESLSTTLHRVLREELSQYNFELTETDISNLHIQSALLHEAQEIGQHQTTSATINTALEEYIARKKQQQLSQLFHQIDYDADYDYKAERKKR